MGGLGSKVVRNPQEVVEGKLNKLKEKYTDQEFGHYIDAEKAYQELVVLCFLILSRCVSVPSVFCSHGSLLQKTKHTSIWCSGDSFLISGRDV